MPVTIGRGTATTVAATVSVIAAIRVASCSSGRVLVQQVGLGGSPRWSGADWDLDLARAFHCLETERQRGSETQMSSNEFGCFGKLTMFAVLPHDLRV